MTATGECVEPPVAVMPAPTKSAPVVLVGASLGGLLALMNADPADALVLVNPMPTAPLAAQLPGVAEYPAIIPWRSNASLAGTRRALPDADEATWLYAFRRWRDESGAVMAVASAGVVVPKPACPVLVIASEGDSDVPPSLSRALARWLDADFELAQGSHVGPLLGRNAASVAERVVAWLNGHVQVI